MFMRGLTGLPPFSRVVHGLLLIDKLKTLSIFANSISGTPFPCPGINGFTGLMSISYNQTKRPHGFTSPAPYGGAMRFVSRAVPHAPSPTLSDTSLPQILLMLLLLTLIFLDQF